MDDRIFNKLYKLNESKRYNDKEQHKILSKKTLIGIMQKKIRTIMIGALSKYEDYFGEEFGYDKKDEECTEEQNEKWDKWIKCREEILNLGNKEIRSVEKEIERYIVELVGYKINFKKEG